MSKIVPADFWKWAYSDFMSNALRGVLAEYIVAKALQCTDRPRVEWDAYDLESHQGLRIEVKSASYLQTWKQRTLSPIRFDISSKRSWNSKTNTTASEPTRSAHVYVFCVFSEISKESADPLRLDQWFFIVCTTEKIIQNFGSQKSVSLSSLEKLGLTRIHYESIASEIERLRN